MILATRRNMQEHPGSIAVDKEGYEFSATPGDYWFLDPDEPVTDVDGEPLILARPVPGTYELL